VRIRHADDIVAVYCHMLTHQEGQTVAVRQVIGVVGSSGHSTAPHLHFEVHLGSSPTDPITFMAKRGAPLGHLSGIVEPRASPQR